MTSSLHFHSPRGSRASTPILVEDYDYVPQDFNEMLYQMQTDRACMPYSIPSDQLLLSQSEGSTIEHMLDSGLFTDARAALDAVFEREGIPPHTLAHMTDSIAKEAALEGLPPYSPAWTPNHNTIVVSTNTPRDPSIPPEYSPSRSETPSLYSDAEASSSSSSSAPATPASVFSKHLYEEDIEETMCEDLERVAELARDATVIAGLSAGRKRSRTVSTADEDLDFEPHVAKPPPRKRARVTRPAIVESDVDSSDSDSDEPPARKHKVTKRGGIKPAICRCGHDRCQNEPGFSSVRVYERHYRSVHLGSSTDVRCKGCNMSFESGRKDSVIRHQNQNNGEKCRGTGIIMPDKTRRAPVPKAIML